MNIDTSQCGLNFTHIYQLHIVGNLSLFLTFEGKLKEVFDKFWQICNSHVRTLVWISLFLLTSKIFITRLACIECHKLGISFYKYASCVIYA